MLIGSIIVLGTIGGISTELSNQPKTNADTSPLVSQVDNNTKELANHDARITNSENDIKDLQNNTNTPPSTNKVTVPIVPTPSPTPDPVSTQTPNPIPVTITAFQEIVIDPDTSDCEYTYSDGTTYQFHWKVSNLQGAWATDSFGNNGHYVKTTQYNNKCDNSVIGKIK